MKTYYQRNREKILAYAKKRYAENPDYNKEWSKNNPDKIKMNRHKYAKKQKEYYEKWYKENGRNRATNYREKILEWEQLFPERKKIQRQLINAVRLDEIKRPEICSQCGRKTRIQAHHFNYDHFMNIIWLCASCHKNEHNK